METLTTNPTVELREIRKNQINGDKFDSYDVWIDNKFYCSTRYSDFAVLAERIDREFSQHKLPPFPPKKLNMSFFSLNNDEVEERRLALQTYLQKAFEISKFHEAPEIKTFFFAQREIFLQNYSKVVEEKVYLMDDSSIVVKMKTSTNAEELLKMVAESLQLSPRYISDFTLFQVPDDSSQPEVKIPSHIHPWLSCRDLEFSSPGIEGKQIDNPSPQAPATSKVYIKKWVFSPQRLLDLMRDSAALKLVYLQAQADIKNKLIFPTTDEKAELRKFTIDSNFKDYMKFVRNCRGFGVTYMAPCKANHPEENSQVMLGVSVDGLELHIIVGDKRTGEEEVLLFTWDKIKRWKYSEFDQTYSFQYFFTPKKDKWIICQTQQFLFVSNVIQEYVEELKRRMRSAGHTFQDKAAEEEETKPAPAASAQTPAQAPTAAPAPQSSKQPAPVTQPSKQPASPKQTSEPKSPIFENGGNTGPGFAAKFGQLSLKSGGDKTPTKGSPFIGDDDL